MKVHYHTGNWIAEESSEWLHRSQQILPNIVHINPVDCPYEAADLGNAIVYCNGNIGVCIACRVGGERKKERK